MSQGINLHKKHVIEYDESEWFANDRHNLFNILCNLGVRFEATSDETEFEIHRESLKNGIEILKHIENGETMADVDTLCLHECLYDENMSVGELIQCFEWMVENGDKNNTYIYMSFFD